jgi:hypothetical protein
MQKFTGTVETMNTIPLNTVPLVAPIINKTSSPSLASILSNIVNQQGSPLVSSVQAKELTDLRFSVSDEPILSLDYREFVYEIVYMLNILDYDVVKGFLSTDWEKIFGVTGDIRDKMLFAGPLLKQSRDKLLMDMEIYRGTTDVVVGAEDCRKCGSKETLSVAKQQRSADEPMTIRCHCLSCGNKWVAQ